MSLPAIAVRTYNYFKDDSSFRKLIKQMRKKLAKLGNPMKAASYVHKKIDEEIEQQFKNPNVKELVSCKRGCNACCHTQVAVTEGEAALLAERILEDNLDINFARLLMQANFSNDSSSFYKLAYQDRACVFLSDEGTCQAYDIRPSVCRTNFVLSDPANCKVTFGSTPQVQLLNTFGPDSWVYSLFKESKFNGSLPVLLNKILNSSREAVSKKNGRYSIKEED